MLAQQEVEVEQEGEGAAEVAEVVLVVEEVAGEVTVGASEGAAVVVVSEVVQGVVDVDGGAFRWVI